MPTLEEIKTIKARFAEMAELPGAGHKLIDAARSLRAIYADLPADERQQLIEWVRLVSDLDTFITGEHKTYYVQVAIPSKALRRADLSHLERYSSEVTGNLKRQGTEEYLFNIWKSEWKYVEGFLNQYGIAYRLLNQDS